MFKNFYEIPNISGLATNSALTVVENKIPDVSSLVKETDYNTKISDIEKKITDHDHDKYITTLKFNTMAASTFNARLVAQTDLIRKPEFDAKLKSISDKVTLNKYKHFLVENELRKLEKFDVAYFRVKIILMVVMAHKIILYFNQCTNTLKHLLKVVLLTFLHENQKDCLMKKLVLLPHLIIIKL